MPHPATRPPSCLSRRPAFRHRFALLFLATAAGAGAQPAARSADDDWRGLQTLLGRVDLPSPAQLRTPVARTAARNQRLEKLRQAAEQARDFQLRHAGHALAARAHKLEVMARLDHARLEGKPSGTTEALALATAFRADRSRLREQRFEVALAAERLRQAGPDGVRAGGADEQLATALLREFGPIPEVHGLFAGLAARAEMTTAHRLATQLLEMRPPPALRAAAEAITTRYGLVGRPFGLRLTRIDASTFELPRATPATGPTVLYVWTPGRSPEATPFGALSALRRRVPATVNWIYLGLGATRSEARAAATAAPFAGTHCQDEGGPQSAVAQRLRVTSSPTVFVLNRHGVLTGFGRVEELPALLAAATR